MRYSFILIVTVFFCATSSGQTLHSGEAKYFCAQDPDYHSIASARFNFWLDIPHNWRAVDSSTNGDGYFILTGNPRVDARVYGSEVELPTEPQKKTSVFLFRDGLKGVRVTASGSVYFTRQISQRQVTFYLASSDSAWLSENRRQIERIAASLRPGRIR